MHRIALIIALAVMISPTLGQADPRISPEEVKSSPYWEWLGDQIRHVPSGAICPFELRKRGLELAKVSMFSDNGRDVSCHYQRESEKTKFTIFITDYGARDFNDVARSSHRSIVSQKQLDTLNPGSSQCQEAVDTILSADSYAPKTPTPAFCTLYRSGNVYSSLILTPAREWVVKLRYTRVGTPGGGKFEKMVKEALEVLVVVRRAINETRA